LGKAVCPETSDGATYPGEAPGPKSKAGFLGRKHATSFFLNNKARIMSTPATDPTVIPAIAPPDIPERFREFPPSLDTEEVVVVANVMQTSQPKFHNVMFKIILRIKRPTARAI
jgi:hypothetical protein